MTSIKELLKSQGIKELKNPLPGIKVTLNNKKPGYCEEYTKYKQVANGKQTDSNQIANRKQTDSKRIANRKQTDSKREANGKQTDSKQVAERVAKIDIIFLVGKQRKMIDYLFTECLKIGSKTTPILTLEKLVLSLNENKDMVKNLIFRLVEKGYIVREKSKTGLGGWVQFSIDEKIYQQLIDQNGKQTDSKQVAERVAIAPSSNITLDNNNTKTSNIYTAVELEDIELRSIPGLEKDQLLDILNANQEFTIEMLQDSIDRFDFDMRNHDRTMAQIKKVSAGVYFAGAIKNGKPWRSKDANYKSPKEIEIEHFAANKVAEKQRCFEKWFNVLTEKDKKNIVDGMDAMTKKVYREEEAILKYYFEKEIYNG